MTVKQLYTPQGMVSQADMDEKKISYAAPQGSATKTQSGYVESDTVKQAKEALDQQTAAKPGAYQSQWQTKLNDTIDQILNRKDFSYDLNGDALYQQYKDRYTQQGKMAMMDTMGQAAALTGGYGNSYAQIAGQQAYQGYLQELNDVIPELYQLALDKYNQEGSDLYNRYSMLGAQEQQDYGRYQDTMDAWNQERNFYYQQARDAVADSQWDKAFQYQMGRDAVSDNQWNETMQYQKDRDAVADSQWDQSMQYQMGRDAVSDSQWEKAFQYQLDRDAISDGQMSWDRAFQLYQLGIKTPEVLETLGIPEESSNGSGSSSSGSGGSSGTTPEVQTATNGLDYVMNNAKAMIENGSSQKEAEEYVNAAAAAGVISANDRKSLKYTFGETPFNPAR